MSVSGIVVVIVEMMQGFLATITIFQLLFHLTFIRDGHEYMEFVGPLTKSACYWNYVYSLSFITVTIVRHFNHLEA